MLGGINYILGLRENNAKTQKQLYEKYSSRWNALCLRYLKNETLAEDALVNGFMKIFSNIGKFSAQAKETEMAQFESWMYKIMVNECLMLLRQESNFNIRLEPKHLNDHVEINAHQLYEQDILKLLNALPTGCRTIFNLYIIEGYQHKEIANMLHISEGTSKSQLNVAKTKLKELLSQNEKYTKYKKENG